MVIHMRKKVVVILLIVGLLVATGAVLARPGEDSDGMGIIKMSSWKTPFGKEGGDEGVFLCVNPAEQSN